jgi:hypothetical protein
MSYVPKKTYSAPQLSTLSSHLYKPHKLMSLSLHIFINFINIAIFKSFNDIPKMYFCINALSRFMVFCIYLQRDIYKKIIINILLKMTYKIYSSFLKTFYFIDYTYFVEWYKQLKDKHVAISSLSLFCISSSWNSGI